MFIQLLVSFQFLFLVVVAQTPATNSSQGQNTSTVAILPKQGSMYDDYDLNDPRSSAGRIEGSGGGANLDEYADDEEEDLLSKITSTIGSSSSTSKSSSSSTTTTTTRGTTLLTTTTTTTTTTTMTSSSSSTTNAPRRTTTSTTSRWAKPSDGPKKKNMTTTTPALDLDGNEFKDDQEEYADDLEDDVYYNEPTVTSRMTMSSIISTPRYPMVSTRPPLPVNHTSPIWILLNFLTRPPIAVGILAGLAIGIFTSVILLICIIRRYHKRDKSHSSYTTGLLYPNHYGYSKSPQEFYA